jgi:hypothetical protein
VKKKDLLEGWKDYPIIRCLRAVTSRRRESMVVVEEREEKRGWLACLSLKTEADR